MSREEREPTFFASVHGGDLVYVLDPHQPAPFSFHSANFERKLGFHIAFSQVDFVRGVSSKRTEIN